MDPSLSCVANSGLRRKKIFVKGAGHQRKLWSVEPQLTTTAAILYTCLPTGVLGEKGRPQGHVCVKHVVGDSTDDVIIFLIKGSKAIVNSTGVPARVGM